jgi:hypothetical protein
MVNGFLEAWKLFSFAIVAGDRGRQESELLRRAREPIELTAGTFDEPDQRLFILAVL